MNNEVIMKSDDYKQGFTDALFQVVRILNENDHLREKALITLLNSILTSIDKN